MEQLVQQIARISARENSTPVLVTPPYLTLRSPFYIAMAVGLTERKANPVRFDWNRCMSGAFSLAGDWVARWQAARINRALTKASRPLGNTAAVQITAAIGRPTNLSERWLVGISSADQPLPVWTTPVYLITSPSEHEDGSPDQVFHLQSRHLLSAA